MAEKALEEIFASLDQKSNDYLMLCGNCAQTTFLSLQEQFGLDDGGAILKALTAFPGVALRGETCGVVIASLLAIGLVYGRGKENLNDFESYQKSFPPSRRFCRQFEKDVGSTMCGDIIELKFGKRYDLADPTQAVEWMCNGAIDKCGVVIQKGVHIAAEIMLK